MRLSYPTSLEYLDDWAQEAGVTSVEGRIRLAQFSILYSISSHQQLRDELVFKGGNALDFIWLSNRSTRDLDFSINHPTTDATEEGSVLRATLAGALSGQPADAQILLALQSFRQAPPRPDATFATFRATVGYAFVDEPRLLLRVRRGQPSPTTVPIDISINEVICSFDSINLGPKHELRVTDLCVAF